MKTKKHEIVKTPGYKGFYHDLTTAVTGRKNLTHWEEGKTVRLKSKAPPIPCSEKALHFCEEPSAVLGYYPPVAYGEKNRYAEVEAGGAVERVWDKTGCKALKVKKVFESIWDFAKSFKAVFNAAINNCCDWIMIRSEVPVAGEHNSGPILLRTCNSAVKSYYPVVLHGMSNDLLESASLAMVLGGEQNMAVSSSCAIVRAEGSYVFAEVTSPAGIAVVLVNKYTNDYYRSRAFVRGVRGSTFIFLRSCASPVIVKVDGDKIKAGRYYYMNIDGTVKEYEAHNPESKGV